MLIIDDEAAIRESLADLLEDEGYEVVNAQDGEEGLSFWTRGRLILCCWISSSPTAMDWRF